LYAAEQHLLGVVEGGQVSGVGPVDAGVGQAPGPGDEVADL
jgi:hypothetical protein